MPKELTGSEEITNVFLSPERGLQRLLSLSRDQILKATPTLLGK
jgi:hypothetical protein